MYAPQTRILMSPLGPLPRYQQTKPLGPYMNCVTKSSHPMSTGTIGLIGA